MLYVGGASGSTSHWEEDTSYTLFECHDGETLEAVDYPVPDEVPVRFCATEDVVYCATHRGTLLAKEDGAWARVGSVPTPGEVSGRYLPLVRTE